MNPFELENCENFLSKTAKKKRPFIDQKYPMGNFADPFEAKRICSEIDARLQRQRYIDNNLLVGWSRELFSQSAYPDQQGTSLCGPAAFWYCLLKDRPDLYKHSALELWKRGKTRLRKLKISPSKYNRRPSNIYSRGSISGLDWMMLAGLRDSENDLHPYQVAGEAGGPYEGWSGLTFAGELESWFKKVGSKIIFSDYAVYGLDINHPDLGLIEKFNQYAGNPNYHVVTVIGSGMLRRGGQSSPKKDHWIVWESPVTVSRQGRSNEDTYYQLKAFTWGNVEDNCLKNQITLKKFVSYVFGGFIAKKIP